MSLFKSIVSPKKEQPKKPLRESRIIPVVHPTQNQSAVMAKIAGAATPKLAAAAISDNANLSAARDMLEKMGLIKLSSEGAFLTDQGKEVMVNQNLIDQGGGLTPDGQQLANDGKQGAPGQPAPGADMADDGGLDLGMDMDLDLDNDGQKDDGNVGLELDLGDDDDESEDSDKEDEPKMKAAKQGTEDTVESFSLLPELRHQAVVESLGKVPRDLLGSLTPEEHVALRNALDGNSNLSDNESLMAKLYKYYRAEMPYGTAKARTGDPEQWLLSRLA